jgi:hypothetical protein
MGALHGGALERYTFLKIWLNVERSYVVSQGSLWHMSAEAVTMTNRLHYTASPHDRKATLSSDMGMGHDRLGARLPLSGAQSHAVHTLFQQLAQSLSVLSGACELVLEGKSTAPSGQALRVWLQPHARQAETAMHKLRDLRVTKSPALTDLSQSLTVLVLAADMLTQGQLSGEDALMFYGLLRRNAEAAMKSLGELRAQLDPETSVVYQ